MRLMKDKPTVETVTDGLAKTIREVRQLQKDVRSLTAMIGGFTEGRQSFEYRLSTLLPPEADPQGSNYHIRGETDEPRSAIAQARYEYGKNPNLEAPTRTLLAIARELDGALRDIRSTKLDVKAILDDSDLRREFKEWQRSNAAGR